MTNDKFGVTKFGLINEHNIDHQWRSVRVVGIEYIFKVLCLMCKIMIYRLPVRDNIDRSIKKDFKNELKELME